jgi:hypothetical protein
MSTSTPTTPLREQMRAELQLAGLRRGKRPSARAAPRLRTGSPLLIMGVLPTIANSTRGSDAPSSRSSSRGDHLPLPTAPSRASLAELP